MMHMMVLFVVYKFCVEFDDSGLVVETFQSTQKNC